MRNGFLVVTFVAFCSCASAACGGSSSETPFPIEPNQAELRSGMLTRAHYVPSSRRKDAGRSAEDDEQQSGEPPDPSEGTEGSRGADDEANENTPATDGVTTDPNPSGSSGADGGTPVPSGAAPPTWGGPRAPKR